MADDPGQVSARLHANPEYQAALREAESDSWDGPGVSAEEMIAAADERRRAGRDPVDAWLADAWASYEAFGETPGFPALLDTVEAVLALTRDSDGNDLPSTSEVPIGEFRAAVSRALLGEGEPGA